MAYIKKRGEYWRAEVRRKGHKPVYRTFDTQVEAQKWARKIETEIDTGFYVDNSAAEKMTLGGSQAVQGGRCLKEASSASRVRTH